MSNSSLAAWRSSSEGIERLLAALRRDGFEVIGPHRGEMAIEYGPITSCEDLPKGIREIQEPGSYRLESRHDSSLFGFTVGPHSWKQFLFPAKEKLWELDLHSITVKATPAVAQKRAFFAVRACDAAAVAIQDRVFVANNPSDSSRTRDSAYASRRENVVLIGVNCYESAATCFCHSMGTGPSHVSGVDIAITEFFSADEALYLLEGMTEWGASFLRELQLDSATEFDFGQKDQGRDRAIQMQHRSLPPDTPDRLLRNLSSERWNDIASRCLSCANCTLVCPTCFCYSIDDTTDLSQETSSRWRRWESCFNEDHSYVVGGPIRSTIASRYRQWLTHKLATWYDQFGTSGCTGCGRCITWCPVGIDLTEEVHSIEVHSEDPQSQEARDRWDSARIVSSVSTTRREPTP